MSYYRIHITENGERKVLPSLYTYQQTLWEVDRQEELNRVNALLGETPAIIEIVKTNETKEIPMENQEQFYQHELNCNGFVAMKYTEAGQTIVSVYDPYQDMKLMGHWSSFVEAHKALC